MIVWIYDGLNMLRDGLGDAVNYLGGDLVKYDDHGNSHTIQLKDRAHPCDCPTVELIHNTKV